MKYALTLIFSLSSPTVKVTTPFETSLASDTISVFTGISEVLSLAFTGTNEGAITKATTDINFNKMLRDGPEVSLNGSPTVSPTTAALWASVPLRPDSSIIFLALSHAPPALDWKIAIRTPHVVTPASNPPSISALPKNPTSTGTTMANKPGSTISLMDACVENRANAVNAAEAIAKPLPIAAVVLPTASNLSVLSLTSGSNSAISAIPPALSEIGP